jgi:hypothetical protein
MCFIGCLSGCAQLEDVLIREVSSNRIRVREFFSEFDRMRTVRARLFRLYKTCFPPMCCIPSGT